MKQNIPVVIQAPPDRVFYWLDDAERVMQWIEGVVENEDLEVKEGGVGSTQVLVELERPLRGLSRSYEVVPRARTEADSTQGPAGPGQLDPAFGEVGVECHRPLEELNDRGPPARDEHEGPP